MSTRKSEWMRYGLAVILSVAAFAARALCSALGGSDLTYSFFYLVIVVVTRFAGVGPGMLAVLLAHVAAVVRFHAHRPGVIDWHFDPWKFWVASTVSLALVWVCHGLRGAARNAEALARERTRAAKHTDEILAGMPDAFIAFDPDWRVTAINPAAEEFFGRPAAELLGHVFWDAFPALLGGDTRPLLLEAMTRRSPAELEIPSTIRPDRWIELRIFPLGAGLSIYVRDVTVRHADALAQRRAEDALREGEQRLRTALDAGECGVWDWEIATGRVTWSERVYRFHGLSVGEFDGTREGFERLIHPDDRPRVACAIERAIADRAPYHVEFRTVRPDGSVAWLSTSGAVTFDGAGRPLRLFGATIDTTDRKRHEEEREQLLASERAARADAERASRLKDEFLATVSHELRTPLNAILGWSQLLRASVQRGGAGLNAELADDLGQGMETIERNARVQAQLVEDLLDMSRIISGKLRLNVESVDLPHVIAAAIESVRPTADAKGITLQKAIEPLPKHAVVRGDPQRLQQVVWNLLTNAIKFTPRGGRVCAAVRPARMDDHPAVEIEVADSGQGIPPDFLAHAFERFRQADASSTRKHGGLGLGLSIVKNLAELHGGTVHAHSDGEGRGATFTVCLPLVEAGDAATRAAQPRQPAPFQIELGPPSLAQPLRGIKVLVVDDEADARDLLRRVLEDREASVATAGSAPEALEMLSTFCPDVLLSDIGMPGQDGLAFIREVRARSAQQGGNTPAAAVTAFARAEDKDRALTAGYQAHVAKPVEPAHLVAAVAHLAAKRDVPSAG